MANISDTTTDDYNLYYIILKYKVNAVFHDEKFA